MNNENKLYIIIYIVMGIIGIACLTTIAYAGSLTASKPTDNTKGTFTTLTTKEQTTFFDKYPRGVFTTRVIKDKFGVECADLYNGNEKYIARVCSPLGIEDAVSKWAEQEVRGATIIKKGNEIKKGVSYEK